MLGKSILCMYSCTVVDQSHTENTFGYSRSNICILADILDDADGKEDKLRWPSKTTIVSR